MKQMYFNLILLASICAGAQIQAGEQAATYSSDWAQQQEWQQAIREGAGVSTQSRGQIVKREKPLYEELNAGKSIGGEIVTVPVIKIGDRWWQLNDKSKQQLKDDAQKIDYLLQVGAIDETEWDIRNQEALYNAAKVMYPRDASYLDRKAAAYRKEAEKRKNAVENVPAQKSKGMFSKFNKTSKGLADVLSQ